MQSESSTIWVAAISSGATLLAAAVSGIFLWLRYYPKDRAEAKGLHLQNEGQEVDIVDKRLSVADKLEKRIEQVVKEKFAEQEAKYLAETENYRLKQQVRILEGEVDRLQKRLESIYMEIGSIREQNAQTAVRERELAEREHECEKKYTTLQESYDALRSEFEAYKKRQATS